MRQTTCQARNTATAVAGLWLAVGVCEAVELNWEPKAEQYFFGRSISLPLQEREKRYDGL